MTVTAQPQTTTETQGQQPAQTSQAPASTETQGQQGQPSGETQTPAQTGAEAGTQAPGTDTQTQQPGDTQDQGSDQATQLKQQVTQLQDQVTTLTQERDDARVARDKAIAEKAQLESKLDEMQGLALQTLEADLALLSEEQRAKLTETYKDPVAQRKQIDFMKSMGLLVAPESAPKGKVFNGLSGSGESEGSGPPKTVKEASNRVKEENRKRKKK